MDISSRPVRCLTRQDATLAHVDVHNNEENNKTDTRGTRKRRQREMHDNRSFLTRIQTKNAMVLTSYGGYKIRKGGGGQRSNRAPMVGSLEIAALEQRGR
jgi:hypothetical protein